jgi:2OG-Fe(II) oxygenase superfamily
MKIRTFNDSELEKLAAEFPKAAPFPHVVIDDLVIGDPSEGLRYPAPDWPGWHRYESEYQPEKMICDDIERIPEEFAQLIRELTEPTFLRQLERITGIQKLIPDPYLNGGGLHSSGPGGVLKAHSDFHNYERLTLYRRLNAIVYFNPDWTAEDGANLQFWGDANATTLVRTIVPVFGRCVIFQTDFDSVHGFHEPVRGPRYRNSIALYYYTVAEAAHYSGDTSTYWREHEKRPGIWGVRMRAYRVLLFCARGVAFVAHRVNPNRMKDPTKKRDR